MTETKKACELQCPVCGYYCLGKGGIGCIDKPTLCEQEDIMTDKSSERDIVNELVLLNAKHLMMIELNHINVIASYISSREQSIKQEHERALEEIEKPLKGVSDMENLFCSCCEDTQEAIDEALSKIQEHMKEGRWHQNSWLRR